METRANYVLVGAFTLITLVVAFILVLFITRLADNRDLLPLDVRIPGSVTGLGESSQVYFNGIRVGQVHRLVLDDTNPAMVIAKTQIAASTPVTRSTEATLGFQGLTGLAFIELKGGSLDEANLLEEAEKENAVARIDADPSTINNLLTTAQNIFARADNVLGELEGFAREVRGPMTETVYHVNRFTSILEENRETVGTIITDAGEMIGKLNAATSRIDGHIDGLLTKLDAMLSPDNQQSIVVEARETLASIRQLSDNLNSRVDPIVNNVERFSNQGLRQIEALLNDGRRSVTRIERAIGELEKNPQRLIFGGGNSVPQYDGRPRR